MVVMELSVVEVVVEVLGLLVVQVEEVVMV
jgi:hypothetical protein